MSLKIIKMKKELSMEQRELDKKKTEMADIEKREKEAEMAIEEIDETREDAKEDMQMLDEEVNNILEEKETLEKDIKTRSEAIEEKKIELEELEKRSAEALEERGDRMKKKEAEMEVRDMHDDMTIREALNYKNSDTYKFYQKLTSVANRDVTNVEETIPTEVMVRITNQIKNIGNVMQEVDVIPMSGELKVVYSIGGAKAFWLDCCGKIQGTDIDMGTVSLDCYKVGAYISICNAMLDDSMVNFAARFEEELTKAIVKAVEWAIFNGDLTLSQPTGIIPSVEDEYVYEFTNDSTVAEITEPGAIVEETDGVDEVIAVMHPYTFRKYIRDKTFTFTADGKMAVNTGENILEYRYIKNKAVPKGVIVYGDYKKYALSERQKTTVSSSKEIGFLEDTTYFKAVARYDGQPGKTEDGTYFAIAKITDASAVPEVLATLPADNTYTTVESSIGIAYDRLIELSTAIPTVAKTEDATEVSITFEAVGSTLLLKPVDVLEADTEYTVTIPVATVKAGVDNDTELVFTFKTVDADVTEV